MKKLLIIAIIFWTNFVLNAQTNTTGFGQQNMYISPITAEIQAILDKSDSLVNSAKINAFMSLIDGNVLDNDSLKITISGMKIAGLSGLLEADEHPSFLFIDSKESWWGVLQAKNILNSNVQHTYPNSRYMAGYFQLTVDPSFADSYNDLIGMLVSVISSNDSSSYIKSLKEIKGAEYNVTYSQPYQPNQLSGLGAEKLVLNFSEGADTINTSSGVSFQWGRVGGLGASVRFNSNFYGYHLQPDAVGNLGTHFLPGYRYYHTYFEGDYPLKTGGTIIQKVYTTDVSNPPTDAELDAAFPNAEVGETIYINDNGAGTDLYEVTLMGSGVWGIIEMTVAL